MENLPLLSIVTFLPLAGALLLLAIVCDSFDTKAGV